MRMKRTNLVLDPQLLEEAVRLSGERTYSRTVSRALEDFIRRARAGRILELVGSGAWDGDLVAMRGDAYVHERSPAYGGARRSRARRAAR
jgi:Arc/MetJ family transcription regulator